jgi:hypothetical protein
MYNDRSKISIIQRSDDTARGTEECRMIGIVLYSEKNLLRCYFVYHKSHMEGGPQLRETVTNYLSHALHASGRRRAVIGACFIVRVRYLLSFGPWNKTNYGRIFLSVFPESIIEIVQP